MTFGDIVMQAFPGGVRVVEAPAVVKAQLEMLVKACPHAFKVTNDRIIIADQVIYRVVGWADGALLLILEEDARPAAAEPGAHR